MKSATVKPLQMKLLPPPPGTCRICAVDHPPELPHNYQSLFYQVRFKMRYGRDPTWADAGAHCNEEMQAWFREEVEQLGGKWNWPPDGCDTIAEPIDG